MEKTNKTFELIGVGNPLLDLLVHVENDFLSRISGEKGGMVLIDSPALDQLLGMLTTTPTEAPGGSAGNTASALARLGVSTTFLGKLGPDAGGDRYREAFNRHGGDVSRFKTGVVPNGCCVSLVTPDSERTMRTFLGAAMTMTADEVSIADFHDCRHAHIEGYLLFNRDLMFAVLKAAKAAGCTISLDLASFEVVRQTRDILPGLLSEYVDILFANEEEAAELCGHDMSDQDLALELNSYCPLTALKLGARGAIIGNNGILTDITAHKVERLVDTTGAGDFWAAGFLYGWLRGKSLPICGYNGSLLGAEVIQVMGAQLGEQQWQRIQPILQ